MKPAEMKEVMAKFKEKHPNVEGLNCRQMKAVLEGELVMVRIGRSKRKFTLMTKEDVKPGGKLDRHNKEVKEINKQIRAINKVRRNRAENAFSKMLNAAKHGQAGDIEKIFDNYLKGK